MIDDIAKPKEREYSEAPRDWRVELKYDGTRHFLIQEDGETKLINKRGKDKSDHFPDITRNLGLPEGTILDGETVVTDEAHPHGNKNKLQSRDGGKPVFRGNGKKNFQPKIKMKKHPATFVAFDVLSYSENNLRDLEISERREKLEEIVDGLKESVKTSRVFTNIEDGWAWVKENDAEGLVVKRPESRYPEGRTSDWFKVKHRIDVERKVVDFEEHSKGITAITEQGDRVTVNGRQSKKVKKVVEEEGSVRCEITCLEKTENGRLREPTWKSRLL